MVDFIEDCNQREPTREDIQRHARTKQAAYEAHILPRMRAVRAHYVHQYGLGIVK